MHVIPHRLKIKTWQHLNLISTVWFGVKKSFLSKAFKSVKNQVFNKRYSTNIQAADYGRR
jgi:hypothetical protein